MRKLLILTLALLFCVLSIAFISCEEEEKTTSSSRSESQGLEFKLHPESNAYIVTGIGTCADTNIVIPNTYENKPVTAIGAKAFKDCSSLESIIIPNNVISIGAMAFYDCSWLESVTIEGNASIYNDAFRGCTSFTSVTIGNSATSIGYYSFHFSTLLERINVDESNPNYKSIDGVLYTKDGATLLLYPPGKKNTSFTIPNSVTSIGEQAFYNCTSLASITIPNSVTSIENHAFSDCTSLTSVTIPNSVTSVGSMSFYSCDKLIEVYNLSPLDFSSRFDSAKIIHTSLDEPSILETVDSYIFMTWEGKYYLVNYIGDETEITLPESYKGNNYQILNAFSNNKKINKVIIPNNVTSIGEYAFYYCTSLASITIPNSVTSIENHAFSDCTSLTSVTIPNSVTSIGGSAFYNCTSLTSITIGDSVTSIGSYAFSDCDSLASVTIPNNITFIGNYAFHNCDSLTNIIFENPNGWWYASSNDATSGTNISSSSLSNASTAAKYLTQLSGSRYIWKRN